MPFRPWQTERCICHPAPSASNYVQVSGTLANTGHDVRLTLDDPGQYYINITGGPLTYQYRVSDVIMHFGNVDSHGSEHTVNGMAFPAEVESGEVLRW